MKLKTIEIDGKVYAEVSDGKPVYEDNGKDVALDGASLSEKVTHLKQEADKAFKSRDEAKAELRKFSSIEDVDAAVKAMETVKNLDQKKLIDAGEVERVKQEIAKSFEGQIKEKDSKIGSLESTLNQEMIGGRFARSKTVAEKLAIPSDLVQAKFGQQFKVEDGRVTAYDMNGNKVYSRSNPGELADFDEALDLIIEQYPHKEHILKGPAASGGGAQNGGGRQSGVPQYDPSKLGGSREDRKSAIAAQFPELSKSQ
jgi:hypothetical protein